METARNKTKKKKVEVPKPPTAKELEVKGYLEDLASSTQLSKWETDFLEDITEWWMDKGFLTDKQFDRLKAIWERQR